MKGKPDILQRLRVISNNSILLSNTLKRIGVDMHDKGVLLTKEEKEELGQMLQRIQDIRVDVLQRVIDSGTSEESLAITIDVSLKRLHDLLRLRKSALQKTKTS